MSRDAQLLCIGMPTGSQFGIDLTSWVVTEKFAGVFGIPTGNSHICTVRSDSQQVCGSCFFIHFGAAEAVDNIIIREWETESETLVPVKDKEQLERYRLGLTRHDFDLRMAPYPQENLSRWESLSSKISCQTVDQIRGLESSEIFNGFPKHIPYDGLSVEEKTAANLDKSSLVQFAIRSKYKSLKRFMSHFQLCFIGFMVGETLEAFEEWKRIFAALCQSETLLQEHSEHFIVFLDIIFSQLKELPLDFFETELSSNNFIEHSLKELIDRSSHSNDSNLSGKVLRITNLLKDSFGIDLSASPSIEQLSVKEEQILNIDDLERLGLL